MKNKTIINRFTFAILLSSLTFLRVDAGNWTLNWTANSSNTYFAMIDVPSNCTISMSYFLLTNGGGHLPSGQDYIVWAGYPDPNDPLAVIDAHEVGRWSAPLVYDSGNQAGLSAVVYGGGNNYFRCESHNSYGYDYSATSGQATAGTYWIEIEGFTSDGCQATVTISINW